MQRDLRIVDMHCDTIMECWADRSASLRSREGHLNLELMKDHGALCQFFALYLTRSGMRQYDPYSLYKQMYAVYKEEIEKNADIIRPALKVQDIKDNASKGLMSSLLTIEDGSFVSDRLERLDEVYKDGVRLITLLWGFPNTIGQPCYDDPADNSIGLTRFGFDVVERMNDLGMVIDVSHISEGAFFDVAKASKAPFMASHSCAKALCGNKRNLTDEQLKVIGQSDSLVGLNFYGEFLDDHGEAGPTVELVMKHLEYMVDKAGIDHIGFGSDFDGIETAGELVNYSGFDKIISAMEKKFTDDQIEKLLNKNALEFLSKTIG